MHVKEIELHNFKAIADFKESFEGAVYLVTGENELGKSTILNAIVSCLTGERSDNLLKKGEEKGYAKIKVSKGGQEYTVEIKFTEKNPRGTVILTQEETGFHTEKISNLQALFEYQDFDAHTFVGWSDTAEGRRKQVELVKSLLPEEDRKRLEEITKEEARVKEERKDTNRDIKRAEAIAHDLSISPEDVLKYSEQANLSDIIDQLHKAEIQNGKVKEAREKLADFNERLKDYDSQTKTQAHDYDIEIKTAEEQLERAKERKQKFISDREAEKKELTEKQGKAEEWLKANKPTDTEALKEKRDQFEEHNEKRAAVQKYQEVTKELTELEGIRLNDENKLDELDLEKREIIKSSKIPVEGLTFNEEGLLLNGIPFAPNEVSTSQEMEIATKLIIAKNPKTKVFRVAQGESLGSEKLRAIVEFANKEGYQGFIEEVRRDQKQLKIEKYEIKE